MNPFQDRARRLRVLALGYAYIKARRTRRERRRRYWVHPILKNRTTQGAWNTCMSEMREHFPDKHRQTFRMDTECFAEILTAIRDRITKKDTFFRKAISAEQRLAVTLYYLSTGDSFSTVALLFRLGTSTVRELVFATCEAIWDCLCEKYLKTPNSPQEWRQIAKDYESMWNFPHCLGAIDGKHCSIQCPPNTGSEYFNYKKFFSIVLLGVCDANYRFTYVDVGTSGRWSDGGTFAHCTLNQAMNESTLNVPEDEPIQGTKCYKYKIPSQLNPQESIETLQQKNTHNFTKK